MIFGTETFVYNYRGQTFPVVLDQVCTHCSRGSDPLLHTGLLQIFQVLGSFSSLHRCSIGFRCGDWLGHSRTLKCFLRSHSLVALAVCLGSLSCWKTQPRPIFNALTEGRRLLVLGPIHPPLNTVQSSYPLCRKAPPKHDVSTPMLHGWDAVLGIVLMLLPPNTPSGVYTKKFYFGLIWPHDLLPCLLWIIQMVFSNLQMGLDMCWLEQGDLACAAGF